MTPMTQAQTATTGQIVGVVTDSSGAVVVGARVALTSDTGVRRETETGGDGGYKFALLGPGSYRLEVTLSGFAPVKLEGIAVTITGTSVVDVTLQVAGLPTTVRSRANRRWCRRKAPLAAPSSTRMRCANCCCRPATSSNC